jgi:hypothetical protein
VTVNQTVNHRCLFTMKVWIPKVLILLDSKSDPMPTMGAEHYLAAPFLEN